MRLTDLDPRWFAEAGRQGQGLTFECPCCLSKPRPQSTRLAVAFTPALDGGPPIPISGAPNLFALLCETLWLPEHVGTNIVPPGIHWQRTGDTFETLTLTPSIDASRAGHWHGFITDGEVQ